MKRLTIIFLFILAGASGFVFSINAADEPVHGGKIVVAQDIDAVGLDPYKTRAFSSWNHFELFYNSLLRFDKDGKLEPDLAVSWEIPDSTTYIFHLRKGVKFHNGQEFNAQDVKATFDRLLDPKTGSLRRVNFKLLDHVEVMDRYTVKFVTSKPFAPFLYYLAYKGYSAILSKSVIDNSDPGKEFIGTGPFQVVEYRPNESMLLKKNPNYWEKGLPYADEVELRLIKDTTSRVAALKAKRADLIWVTEPQISATLMKAKGIVTADAPYTARFRVHFNCTIPPFNNVKVRQALSLATDRKAVVKVALMRRGEVTGPIPPSAGEFALPPEDLPFYGYNPELAKKMLKEAGFPNGFKVTAKISASHTLDQYAMQIIQRQWEKIGVDLKLEQVEWGTLVKALFARDHQIIAVTDIWRPDPDEYINYFVTVKKISGGGTPEIEALVLQGQTTLDHNERVNIYHQIERMLAEDCPILYVTARSSRLQFWRDTLKGYTPTASGSRIYLKQSWIEK